ncbi:E3 ubiquitin-protein ligase TRIM11-like [Amblyraja radiata]|uniref:E3 ubiquitin-protein ligase TRIM11-like n=1 Tax=Amblyraja radiata TaxID=386614 RepID=UPI001401DA0A|nr:E3 ubiquitin-protein ligase TRIM11-like [Amblyraja radiata]
MASKQQLERLREDLICPICLDLFPDPVSPDCGHNSCRSCITQLWEHEDRNSCPECREVFAERTLRVSRALASLAEKARTLNLNLKEKESKLHCEKAEIKSSLESLTQNKLALEQMEQQQKEKFCGNLLRFSVSLRSPADSVTLDLETACSKHEVSEDRKSVRWTGTERSLPDNGKRFTIWPCVLGPEGFTSGRHYWEVEVMENWGWCLGVAAESLVRERDINLRQVTGL